MMPIYRMIIRKSKRSFLLIGVISLGLVQITNAQNIRRLKVGDKIPNILFEKVLNYHQPSLELSDFKGKAIILDIWSRYCSSCIASFPRMQVIAETYSSQLQVLLITRDSEKDFNYIKSRSHIVNATTLPIVIEDTIVRRLFPSTGLPWQVWIDSNGVVRAIHNGKETDLKSISSFLNGEVAQHLKKDIMMDFDPHKSLLADFDDKSIPNNACYSFIRNELSNVSRKWILDFVDPSTNRISGFRGINITLADICVYLFGNIPRKFPESRAESTRFCYELRLPTDSSSRVYGASELKKCIQNDVSRYFNITFVVQTDSIVFYKLIKGKENGKDLKNSSNKTDFISEYYNNKVILKHSDVNELLRSLRRLTNKNKILIDSSDVYPNFFDMELNIPMHSSVDRINSELNRYNLCLVKEMKSMKVVVVKDKNATNSY